MVTPVFQPPQHVANYFQLIETTLGEYKIPSCAWPKGERNFIDIILCWSPNSSLISRASCTFPDFYRKPLFPGDVHQFICHLECTSLESILARQGRDESGRQSAWRSWKDSGDLSTFTTVHVVRNNEEPSCSWTCVLISIFICENIDY